MKTWLTNLLSDIHKMMYEIRVIFMVLKTGLNRPVRPIGWIGIGLVELTVWSVNWTIRLIFFFQHQKDVVLMFLASKWCHFGGPPSKPSLFKPQQLLPASRPTPTCRDRLPSLVVSPQWQPQLYFILLQQWQQEHQVH